MQQQSWARQAPSDTYQDYEKQVVDLLEACAQDPKLTKPLGQLLADCAACSTAPEAVVAAQRERFAPELPPLYWACTRGSDSDSC